MLPSSPEIKVIKQITRSLSANLCARHLCARHPYLLAVKLPFS
jgi:hypothetical protein